jgi:hypothetical protein
MRNQLPLRQLLLRVAVVGLFWLCPASVSAQLPDDIPTPVPLAVRPTRIIGKPVSNPVDDPLSALRSAKTIYVRSSSVFVAATVVEDKLQKRAEFSQMCLVITRDSGMADLILELHHDVFTKYVYTAIDTKTNTVVATGKLSSLGGTVGGKVAKRFLKQMMKARGTAPCT